MWPLTMSLTLLLHLRPFPPYWASSLNRRGGALSYDNFICHVFLLSLGGLLFSKGKEGVDVKNRGSYREGLDVEGGG